MEFFMEENLWFYLPLILWIGGIFYFSSEKGSISNSSRYLSPVFGMFFPKRNPDKLKIYHLYLRKICHFVAYGILAFFASLGFYNSPVFFAANSWYFSTFLIVLLVASADEIKQSFSTNRIGSFFDVMLDCIGGLTVIFLMWIFAVIS
jgi:VanZ family protein